jgi:hypothetical protein
MTPQKSKKNDPILEELEKTEKKIEEMKELEEASLKIPIPPPEVDEELENILVNYDDSIIKKSKTSKDLSKEEVMKIINRIRLFKGGIGLKAAVSALATLFRKGAANAGASDSIKVEILCPETDIAIEINRYDIVMAMQQVVDHRNVRKLAEAMAPEMISANLRLLEINPLLDLKGDLANRINRKLSIRKEKGLTRKEEICCCTYSQWMPNLNELAGSLRLKGLLEEDLNARRKQASKRSPKVKKETNKKVNKNK